MKKEREQRILHAVGSGARFGSEIAKASGVRAGSMYPVLTRLERRGDIGSVWEVDAHTRLRRRAYFVTPTPGCEK